MGQVLFILVLTLTLVFQQPAEATANFNRAVELQQQGKLNAAADEYRAALRLAPDYAEAQANLGAVLSRLGKYEEAVTAFETALKLNPQLTPIFFNLGIAHYRASQFGKAVEAFEKFLKVSPTVVQAGQLLGLSLVELGRNEEAVRQLEQTLRAAPEDAAVLYSLGLAYLRLNRPELPWAIEKLASLPAGAAAAHQLKGLTFFARFEFEKAIAELTEAQKLNAELPRLNYSFGLCYFKLGRNREAIAAFDNELKRKPQDITAMYYLASLHEAEAPDLARRYLDEVLKADPQLPEANALLGKLLVRQNKPAEALKPLELAVTKDATDPEKRYLLARVYQQLGRKAEAAREFAEVQRLKAEKLKQDRANTPKP